MKLFLNRKTVMNRKMYELVRKNVVNSILPPKFSPKPNFCAKELVPRNVCQSECFEVTWRSV